MALCALIQARKSYVVTAVYIFQSGAIADHAMACANVGRRQRPMLFITIA